MPRPPTRSSPPRCRPSDGQGRTPGGRQGDRSGACLAQCSLTLPSTTRETPRTPRCPTTTRSDFARSTAATSACSGRPIATSRLGTMPWAVAAATDASSSGGLARPRRASTRRRGRKTGTTWTARSAPPLGGDPPATPRSALTPPGHVTRRGSARGTRAGVREVGTEHRLAHRPLRDAAHPDRLAEHPAIPAELIRSAARAPSARRGQPRGPTQWSRPRLGRGLAGSPATSTDAPRRPPGGFRDQSVREDALGVGLGDST